jgi:NMD protein affecting ribosome stability and mRNA decay
MLIETPLNLPTLLCCTCGVEIKQNPTNMCVACLRDHVDITEGIPRTLTIYSCRTCLRFLGPPWQNLDLESKELLALCLRKIPGKYLPTSTNILQLPYYYCDLISFMLCLL